MSPPEDGGDFWVQFYKKKLLSYVPENDPPRSIQITLHTGPGNYNWRRIAVPQLTARGHYFWP